MQVFYHDDVHTFIKTLEKSTQSKVLRGINLLELYGRDLSMPHVKHLQNNIFELRTRGSQEIRIFFTYHEAHAYLLHAFIKKTQKIPERELRTAESRVSVLTEL